MGSGRDIKTPGGPGKIPERISYEWSRYNHIQYFEQECSIATEYLLLHVLFPVCHSVVLLLMPLDP